MYLDYLSTLPLVCCFTGFNFFQMLITTTAVLQDKKIVEHLGVVSSEVIIGANVVRDIFAAFRDFFGGRSQSYEAVFKQAKSEALKEIVLRANALGANAIIGVDYDFLNLGSRGSMLMVAVSGTAVIVEE